MCIRLDPNKAKHYKQQQKFQRWLAGNKEFSKTGNGIREGNAG